MEAQKNIQKKPDYIFEVSWEVCNKVGGIHTVISTKSIIMKELYADHFLMIGPDLYKGATGNVEFIEDIDLFKDWKHQFDTDGLKVRVGRWNIPSKPIAILVDFSPLFSKKDQIFYELWVKNQLDSLRGGWDYIEPALFGYAAGKIIENFKNYYLHQDNLIIAHFHEWLTGAGVLYLENTVPGIATVFTTHATVVGRSICGSGLPFYSNFESYDGDQMAKDFNALSKHSLEKKAALTADAFTTVSSNTARECKQLLNTEVDKITTNGFDDSFLPEINQIEKKRIDTREKLLTIASSVIGHKVSEGSLLVATSGRYEYKNKGIDIFIKALSNLNQKKMLDRDIIAFILVPAAHTSAKSEILSGIQSGNYQKKQEFSVTTHYLQDPDNDAIVQEIKRSGLFNEIQHKVKIVFAPVYLDGRDGVFNVLYYDILLGMDLTIFPSYYEPFGYTPLESLAFHVPTITATLTGFGSQVQSLLDDYDNGIFVVERSDFNNEIVIEQIANYIQQFSLKNKNEIQEARDKAFTISRSFLWKNLIQNYNEVYEIALEKFYSRAQTLQRILEIAPQSFVTPAVSNEPIWRSAMVRCKLPERLQSLDAISKNLWWTWNREAIAIFSSIDQDLWEQSNHNPIALFGLLSYERFMELEEDQIFLSNLQKVNKKFTDYISARSDKSTPKIAYLSMEYGLHESLPLYSGGLGILAGDYLKEASDQGTDIVAFGLLYRYGYFEQGINTQGEQVAQYKKQHFTQLPIQPVRNGKGNRILLQFPLRGAIIKVQVWKVTVGKIPLYLFDTDISENSQENRKITYHLYGGDSEYRLRQELLLAVSTLQLLESLSITPDIYHYNEGHTAFTGIFRILRSVMRENLSVEEAKQLVTASTLFTTHTPVPAGQDRFSEDLLRSYQSHFSEALNISWNYFLGLGKINASDSNEPFSMTYLGARLSGEINAVSKIHAEVTRKMLKPLWKGFLEEELQIDSVNNGVHYATWTAPSWQELFEENFGKKFLENILNSQYWSKVKEIPSQKIIAIKRDLKKKLIKGVRNKLQSEMRAMHWNPKETYEILHSLKDDDLIIGFARRFPTYKRADLLFRDLDRLSQLVNNKDMPVKFIFAGKAHPTDLSGQVLIKKIIEISKKPEFIGKILFIQDYDMALARLLVQGVDVWLNTPLRGNEASGTSGMKAMLNGTLNFSVLDGWWAEAYSEKVGWALPCEPLYENQSDQDDLDADTIYNILEHEIIPEFFNIDASGISESWVDRIKNAFAHVASKFTTTAMLSAYEKKYYDPMSIRLQKLKENKLAGIKTVSNWSKKMNEEWPNISVADVRFIDHKKPLELGSVFSAEISLNLNGISAQDIGAELIFAKRKKDGTYTIRNISELQLIEDKNHRAIYRGETKVSVAGAFQYDIRFFPKNPMLKYRRDLPLVTWV